MKADRDLILSRLGEVTLRVMAAEAERDDLIFDALDAGCSEREIGKAAGMSGPAVHYRKAMLRTSRGASR